MDIYIEQNGEDLASPFLLLFILLRFYLGENKYNKVVDKSTSRVYNHKSVSKNGG